MAKRVWMVTGASRGFGVEIVKAALGAGDQVAATARDTKSLEYVGENENVFKVAMDVTNEKQVKSAVDDTVEHFGRIDVLVNNAGFGLLGAVEEASAKEVEHVYNTNVFGLLNVTRAVLPTMRKQKSGHVVNISSVGGFRGFPGFGIYCSTKFAVEGISEALHGELAPLGIRVTVVEPGAFRTDFLKDNSLTQTKQRIADYEVSAGKTRESAAARNGKQPGDPVKLGQALLQLLNAPEPPLRLPLGTDALEGIAYKLKFVEQETEKWRAVSSSTDFEKKASASQS
jgi:NAD(P)-dependent dehydrogenase (short-subunit alcohol dehydrogenase family)